VIHEEGSEAEVGPRDPYVIEPGHDAGAVGDERFGGCEFDTRAAEEYARQYPAFADPVAGSSKCWGRDPARRPTSRLVQAGVSRPGRTRCRTS